MADNRPAVLFAIKAIREDRGLGLSRVMGKQS